MRKIVGYLMLCFLSFFLSFFSYKYLTGIYLLASFFISGMLFGIFIMFLKLNVKNDKISSYKRELEKESINSDSNLAKVKVLESKISVLEKALENAINKK